MWTKNIIGIRLCLQGVSKGMMGHRIFYRSLCFFLIASLSVVNIGCYTTRPIQSVKGEQVQNWSISEGTQVVVIYKDEDDQQRRIQGQIRLITESLVLLQISKTQSQISINKQRIHRIHVVERRFDPTATLMATGLVGILLIPIVVIILKPPIFTGE